MLYYLLAAEFVERLNQVLIIEQRKGETTFRYRPREPELPLESEKKLVLAQPVDAFIEGSCSDQPSGTAQDVRVFPMGECMVSHGESWLHNILAGQELGPLKRILVYPRCCQTYPRWYQDLLRELFPDHTWIFPSVRDFMGRVDSHEIADDLIKAGILRVE